MYIKIYKKEIKALIKTRVFKYRVNNCKHFSKVSIGVRQGEVLIPLSYLH